MVETMLDINDFIRALVAFVKAYKYESTFGIAFMYSRYAAEIYSKKLKQFSVQIFVLKNNLSVKGVTYAYVTFQDKFICGSVA